METYVIRIGTTQEGDEASGRGALRGVVEHVGSGRREPFRDASNEDPTVHTDRALRWLRPDARFVRSASRDHRAYSSRRGAHAAPDSDLAGSR
jgi:hypothetical protein